MIRPLASGSQKYTAFGLHGPALGLDLSVYGLGLVHAGLRRYIFRDPSARGRIISHYTWPSVMYPVTMGDINPAELAMVFEMPIIVPA